MRKFKVSLIHAHSLKSLPAAVALKFLNGASLIYDAHELETERNGLSGLMKKFSEMIESLLVRFVDGSLVVSQSIADHYRTRYSKMNPVVVRNVPELLKDIPKEFSIREKLGLKQQDRIFLYLGVLAKGRGIEKMLNAFANSQANQHLVFIGGGILEENIILSQCENPKIHWIPPVPSSEVLGYASGADIGLCLIEDVCLSYRYSLPNKFFEYLMAGLPVVVNDLPEQKKIVEKFGCGWVLPECETSLSNLLKGLTEEDFEAKEVGVSKVRKELDWRNEERSYLSLCRSLLYPSLH